MTTKTVTVRLEAATAAYQAAMARASAATRELAGNVAGVGDATDRHMERVGRAALVAAGGLALGLGLSAKAAVSWESAWAGVTKTVDGSAAQMSALQQGLRDMAGELPATHAEIAGVAEVAGQLGVSVGGIEKFTDTMIDLGETTNLSAEEAATGLARFGNIMGTAERDVDRMGSTIVELGNNFATTEGEILKMSTRLAAAGRIAGLSEADVFAFAATLSSVGVEAEAGGTAISKVFTQISDAVLAGNDDLETFAQVAGVTTSEFSARFRDDAAGAIAMFIEGLGRMMDAGQSTTQVFEDLGLSEVRVMNALRSSASAGDLLTNSLLMANDAWEENTALQTEAEQRYRTTASQLEIARNKIVDFGIDLGSVMLPAINTGIGLLGDFADGLGSLPGPAKTATVLLGGLGTAFLGTVGLVGTLAPKAREAADALRNMGGPARVLGNNLGRISVAAAGVGAALTAGVMIYEAATRASREYDETVRSMRASLNEAATGQRNFNDVIEDMKVDLFDELGEKSQTAMRSLRVSMDDVWASIQSGGDALDPLREKLSAAAQEFEALADLDLGEWDNEQGTVARLAGFEEQLESLAGQFGMTAGELTSLIDEIEDYDDAWQDAAQAEVQAMASAGELSDEHAALVAALSLTNDEGTNWVAILEQVSPKTAAAAEGAETFTGAAETQADAIADVEAAISSMMDEFDRLIGVNISVMEATFDTTEGFASLEEQLKKNDGTLDGLTQNSRDNARAINDQVDIIFKEIEARRREGQSVESVTSAARLYVQQLRNTMLQAGYTKEEVDGYVRALNLTPDRIQTLIALSGAAEAEATLNWVARDRVTRISAYQTVYETRVSGSQRGSGRYTVNAASGGLIPEYHAVGGMSGMHPGGPVGTDTVPAWLTPGEFVIRKEAVDSIGVGPLQAMNASGVGAINDMASWSRSQHGQAGSMAPSLPAELTVRLEVSSKDGTLRTIRKTVRTEFGGDVQLALGGR